jgi:hypothetical protein
MEEKIVREQLIKTMIKVKGAMNLMNNGKVTLAYNKILGVYQKLGYLASMLEETEEKNSSSEKMVKYGDSKVNESTAD